MALPFRYVVIRLDSTTGKRARYEQSGSHFSSAKTSFRLCQMVFFSCE